MNKDKTKKEQEEQKHEETKGRMLELNIHKTPRRGSNKPRIRVSRLGERWEEVVEEAKEHFSSCFKLLQASSSFFTTTSSSKRA